jgi:hypothetical protein
MVFKILNTLFLSVLFLDFLDRRFPNETKSFVINLSLNCIYYFGVFQILFFKTLNNINIMIESNETLLKFKKELEKTILKYYNTNLDNNVLNEDLNENSIDNCDNYDFYIQNFTNDNKIVNKQICFIDNDSPINDSSEIKFILVEFNCGDKKFKIDLKTDTFNYYLVGNKFTKDFFIYYVKKHIDNNETFDKDETYAIELIDHNVNKVEFEFNDENNGFILEKSDYKIIKV